jgi:hypothetical protein
MRKQVPGLLALAAALVTAPAFMGSPALAAASSIDARLVQLQPGQKIEQLEWKSLELETLVEPKGEDFAVKAVIEGKFTHEHWNLMLGEKILKPDKNGAFREEIPLLSKSTPVDFVAVGIRGDVQVLKMGILVGEWDELKKNAKAAPPKLMFANAGAGITFLSYQQTRRADLTQISLTVKGGFNYLLFPPKWDFGVSAYFTALPLTSDPAGQIRFFGANLRFGYVFQRIKEPWKVALLGGVYYTTTFSTGNFGFKNMAGPQIFPSVRRMFKKGNAVAGYFKFSPISDGFSFFSLANHEIATGAAYTHPLKSGRMISASVDLANISIEINTVAISSSTITLSVGYGI